MDTSTPWTLAPDAPPLILKCWDAAAHRGNEFLQPLRSGLPVPRGALFAEDSTLVRLIDDEKSPLVGECTVTRRWPDGSVNWLLVDWVAVPRTGCSWRVESAIAPLADSLQIIEQADKISIANAPWTAHIGLAARDPLVAFENEAVTLAAAELEFKDQQSRPCPLSDRQVSVQHQGHLRSTLAVTGTLGDTPLSATVYLTFYRGLPFFDVDVSLLNGQAADHPGGTWPIGQASDATFQSLVFRLRASEPEAKGFLSPSPTSASRPFSRFSLYQASSGGPNWNSGNHESLSRETSHAENPSVGSLAHRPLAYKGYAIDIDGLQLTGERASPLVLCQGHTTIAATSPEFWQNFPKSCQGDTNTISIGIFPVSEGVLHRLQGGERKTHRVRALVTKDASTAPESCEWMRAPAIAGPSESLCASAIAYLTPQSDEPSERYSQLVQLAITGANSFANKREEVDEYGWRNYGDLYADHELAYYRESGPLFSHYNNQYDIVFGLGLNFVRSGNATWLREMDMLARHVSDIDIYHTSHDRNAYNHGLFWHTAHDVSAADSTHRTYPSSGSGGSGGPSSEHNYASGLMLHFFLTGNPLSRAAVLELAQFVIEADDGTRTPLRYLSHAPTGVASQTGSNRYHGPGRGSGNSLHVLLDAHHLTGDEAYLVHARRLIKRCVHPNDDIGALELDNPEVRWSYMVFLSGLVRFLESSTDPEQRPYARAALIHYVSWAEENEYVYLDKPERLLEPTETWAAQELRKSEVFDLAARHAVDEAQRERWRAKAAHFHAAAVERLSDAKTRYYSRPVALSMTFGARRAFFAANPTEGEAYTPLTDIDWGRPTRFIRQREHAARRIVAITVTLGALALLAFAL